LIVEDRIHHDSIAREGCAVVSGCKGENSMSFGLYVIGFIIVIGGLMYGAVLMHVPSQWIVVGSVVLLGMAIATGVKATRQKDPS
jgi:hypothetical protein